jgi:hypothetical protein
MYPSSIFPCPAYAVLGNHDYERVGGNKVEAELAYAKAGTSRWQMPARWYTVSLPVNDPVITFFCLDSNLPGTKSRELWPWSFEMSAAEERSQDAWLQSELAKDRPGQLLAFVAHHPLYTNGIHGDNRVVVSKWDQALTDHHIDLYISGHDHDLQHLEFENHPTSFVVSGGRGRARRMDQATSEPRSLWSPCTWLHRPGNAKGLCNRPACRRGYRGTPLFRKADSQPQMMRLATGIQRNVGQVPGRTFSSRNAAGVPSAR